MPHRWTALTLAALTALASWQASTLAIALHRARRSAAHSRRYQRPVAPARARVLVLGDSTGVGVGSGSPQQSMAGLLAADFDGIGIVNRCRVGATVADVRALVEGWPVPGGLQRPFDLVLLHVGGNDVLSVAQARQLALDAHALLARLSRLAAHVVWIGTADIGRTPLFAPPLSWWLSRRTRRVYRVFEKAAAAHGARFVSFHRPGADGCVPPDLARHASADGVHPNATGYRRGYQLLRRLTPLARWLGRSRAPRSAHQQALPQR